MSIKKYTNFEVINTQKESEGQFITEKDLFIVTKSETEETDFGECHYDVMEVSVYDINNNLLPHKSGNNVAYIRSGDIKNYLYSISTPNVASGQGATAKELAINIEKLLKDLGFTNGILKVNINFVRSRVGNETEERRVWIQEISATRQEIRIVPLKVSDTNTSTLNSDELDKLKNLNKDFKYYKRSILDSISSFQNAFLDSIDSYLETRFGKDFFIILKKDFGLSQFSNYKQKIYTDFVDSVTYYLGNRYYDIAQSNFGKKDNMRFDECEQYDFKTLTDEIEHILYKCIAHNSQFLKRRGVDTHGVPAEFKITELEKQTKDNTEAFNTIVDIHRNIYQPDKVDLAFDDPVYVSPKPIIMHADIPPKVEDTIPPPKVEAAPVSNVAEHILTNNDNHIVKATYTNISGASITKMITPGQTITICALKNSLSFDHTPNSANGDKFSIVIKQPCTTIDVANNSLPPKTVQEPIPVRTQTPAAPPSNYFSYTIDDIKCGDGSNTIYYINAAGQRVQTQSFSCTTPPFTICAKEGSIENAKGAGAVSITKGAACNISTGQTTNTPRVAPTPPTPTAIMTGIVRGNGITVPARNIIN
jgi:hypothetical protein